MISRKYTIVQALLIGFFAQLACGTLYMSISRAECEAKGGIWRQVVVVQGGEVEEMCEMPTDTILPEDGGNIFDEPPTKTPPPLVAGPTGAYLSPTPALARDCNAAAYLQVKVEVVKTSQETYYRECEYRLRISNLHPDKLIWVVRRTNTSIYSSALNSDSTYWYSDLVTPGGFWEKQFRSSYYTNGQFSSEGVDRIAGVHNRPDCTYLLTSEEVMTISLPVEWACGP